MLYTVRLGSLLIEYLSTSFASGRQSFRRQPHLDRRATSVNAHSMDYERAIDAANPPTVTGEPIS